MIDEPVLHRYHPTDRAEVFDLLRASLPEETSARLIAQWRWKFEANPFTPPEGPIGHLIRIGRELAALVAGFRLKMSIGGIEFLAESWGDWVVHPDYRRRKLWQIVGVPQAAVPILISWGRSFSPRYGIMMGWTAEPLTPLLRVLDPEPLVEHLTHSPRLASISAGASAATRVVAGFLTRTRSDRNRNVVRFEAFDDRVDALSQRALRVEQAMVVRDQRYLNWRYCQRPDASYTLFGVEHESELAGFLVSRVGMHQGIRWGYLVDFLAAENSRDVLSSLVEAALDEFRRVGVAAVTCYATDPATRRMLFRRGFVPIRQRDPIHFAHYVQGKRTDLAKFTPLKRWYLTMGDSDFEMSF